MSPLRTFSEAGTPYFSFGPGLFLALVSLQPGLSLIHILQPLEIDQEHLFNTGQLGKKKTLDDLKADLQEAPSRGIPNRPASSCLLDIVEAIIVLALVLFAFDTVTAVGTSGLLSRAVLLDLGIIAVLALLLAGIFLMRRRRSSKSIK